LEPFISQKLFFYDLEFLKTLPIHEIRSGFAEVIKHALIDDFNFYNWLKENVKDLQTLSMETLSESLIKGIKVKGNIVGQDERETGVRAYLNLGHTLGHAIESEMGYGNFTHGEAVMIGMIYALKLSKQILGLRFDLEDFTNWIETLGYESKIPENLSFEKLIDKMKQDKKSVRDAIRFVLLEQLGQPTVKEISETVLFEQLNIY
jgi:3-dehydroquinate synthase